MYKNNNKHKSRPSAVAVNIFLVYFIIASQASYAQNAGNDIVKINKAFIENRMFEMQTTYNLYPNYSTDVVYSTEKGEIKKSGNNQYSRISSLETIVNDKYALVVDNNSRMIMVEPASEMVQKNMLPVKLDTLMKACKSIEYAKPSPGISEYILRLDFSDYQEVDIYFNNSSYLLTKLVLYSRTAQKLAENVPNLRKEKPRLEIDFSDVNLNPKLSPAAFSEKSYININGKTIVGLGKYRSYKIVNGLKTS